jgi:hypothetical protein
MMKKPGTFLSVLLIASLLCMPCPAHADVGQDVSYAARGASKLVGSMFAIPKAMIQDTGRVMFPFGLVTGAVRGTFQTVTGVVSGAVDLARGGAPYAKYAAMAL